MPVGHIEEVLPATGGESMHAEGDTSPGKDPKGLGRVYFDQTLAYLSLLIGLIILRVGTQGFASDPMLG